MGAVRRRGGAAAETGARSDTEGTLGNAAASRRGRLKVYLGFAAGVGKTYTMLEDAQRVRGAGVDVVVGYVEPHERPETAALLQGLEVVPPRQVQRAGAAFAEMDLEAVLLRRADVVLVDELAHTNPPGVRNAKRYEDVRDILAGGSDVWTTVNIQHLASLGDQVAAVTHVRQRETLPDSFLASEASEIVLVDLSVEELRARIADGKVYPRSRIGAALEGFFRAERLTPLREIAMRETARWIEDRRVHEAGGPSSPLRESVAPVADRLLVLAAGRPGDERIVRRGWRLARSLQCDVEVVHVVPAGEEDGPGAAALREICAALALPLHQVPAPPGRHGIGEAVAAYVRSARATHIVAGPARDRRLPWRGSTLQEIMDRLPWLDFIVVGDPSRQARSEGAGP